MPDGSTRCGRRAFLGGAVGISTVALLAACGAPPAANPTAAPKPTEAPAAKPTEAAKPADAKPAEAAKPVESKPAAPAVPAASPQAAPAAGGNLVTVNAGTLATLGDAGWWVAIDQDYFREQGIKLNYQTFNSAADMIAPLSGGQLDTGGGAISAGLFNAIARGVPIKAVADKSSSPPGHGTVGLGIRKDIWDSGKVKKASDLKGMKIAFSGKGIAPETEMNAFLKRDGLTLKDVESVTLGFPEMLTALENKSIDACVPAEPFLTTITSRGVGHIWVRSDEMLPNHLLAVILYAPKFVAEQPDVAKRMIVAYLRGVRDYNDAFFKNIPAKRQAVVNALVKYTPLKDPKLYEAIVVQGLDPNGKVPISSLEADQEFFLSAGHQQQAIDLSKVVDPSYAEAAVQVLGPYS